MNGHVDAGAGALARGEWAEARRGFERALSEDESPEALEGLAAAAWWLTDSATVFRARERAYQLYREHDDQRAAARVALLLAWNHLEFRGARAVSNGWLQIARGHLRGLGDAPEKAMLRLFDAHVALLEEGDVGAAMTAAAEAADVARTAGIVDLEMVAAAITGLALVTGGRVKEGMNRLDEAIATAASGVAADPDAIGTACCYLIYACERVRDYDRAAQWCQWLEHFTVRWGHRPLLGICRAHYASVLMYQGRWAEAEALLHEAHQQLARELPPLAVEASVRLGELRRRQGRHQEAEQLFGAAAPHPIATLARAAMACDRGEVAVALVLVDRYLHHIADGAPTERVAALEVRVRAALAVGDRESAREATHELRRIAEDLATPPLAAAAVAAEGLVAVADGDASTAQLELERAALVYERSGLPYEAALAYLHLAAELRRAGDPAAAERAEAEAAGRLARLASGAAARDVVVATPPPPGDATPVPAGALTARELDVLKLIAEGLTDRQIARRLRLSEHTVHRHASNVLVRLGVSSRAAAVATAGRAGLL